MTLLVPPPEPPEPPVPPPGPPTPVTPPPVVQLGSVGLLAQKDDIQLGSVGLSEQNEAPVATVTDALPEPVPPEPVQERLKVELDVTAIVWEPLVAFDPDHAPDAVQEFAPLLFHDIDTLPPLEGRFEGLAETVTVGAPIVGATVTEALAEFEPPAPVQERSKVELFVTVTL